jgi:putative Holliday junction resolvase
MKYLGIDYGTKRIGLAVSDETGSLAFPLTTVKAGPEALGEIIEIVNREWAEKIIIGESKNLNNEPNKIQKDIDKFKKDLEGITGLPIEYQPELFSSAQAARQFAPQTKSAEGRSSRKDNPSQAKLDAAAAALILQAYLDRIKGDN